MVSNTSVDQSLHFCINPSSELKKKHSVGAPIKIRACLLMQVDRRLFYYLW